MQTVLITGSQGFIGKNLRARLAGTQKAEILTLERGATPAELAAKVARADTIFHLAGVNRPREASAFARDNFDLTKTLAELVAKKKAPTTVIFSSSIQAALDNPYGQSKRQAEAALAALTGHRVLIFRLSNVFGKWSRPHYNSVVATFCHQTVNGEALSVADPAAVVNLVYIDDVLDEWLAVAQGAAARWPQDGYCVVQPIYSLSVGALAAKIQQLQQARQHITVPSGADPLTAKLWATLTSFQTAEQLTITPKVHSDARGQFTELLRTDSNGQESVSTTRPGVSRGGHWHDSKLERFVVLRGQGEIECQQWGGEGKLHFTVNAQMPQIVTIPAGYRHTITNTGSDDLVLLIWSNESYDPKDPDTFC